MDVTNKLKITVVTVTYNSVNHIRETIHSVINQTYPDIEYIIIDGGSKDGTLEIINEYISKISVLVSEPDKGIYDAMNKGVDLANGDYVIFMNSGDIFYDYNVISNMVDKISGEDVIYGKVIRHTTMMDYIDPPKPLEFFSIGMPIDHQAVFVKTNLLQENKFSLQYKIISDFIQLRNIYFNGAIFKNIDIIIAIRDHSYGETHDNWERVGLKEMAQYFGKDKTFRFILSHSYHLLKNKLLKYFLSPNSLLKRDKKILEKKLKNKEIEKM